MKRKIVTKNTNGNRNYKKIVNVFNGEGDEVNALKKSDKLSKAVGIIGAVGSGISGIAGATMANAEVNTTEADNAIESVKGFAPATSSLDALANSYNSLNFANTDYDYNDLMVDPITGLANVGKATVTGALSGASIGGGWGALAGGLAGALSSGIGWAVGKSKAKDAAETLERESMLANAAAEARAINARDTIMSNEYSNLMKNIVAGGGRIHIKPQNRGKFTEYCGGKVTEECIARGKRSSSPTIRKRATFAANARKWHHSLGGNLFDEGGLMFQHGGIFPNGITIIGNGGTHEENPFEGVQIGVDNQGVPNMVEEGEVIWQDYVFSNRLQPSEAFKKKYKVKGKTFADVAKELQKESEERPNDPISKRGLEDSMAKLMMEQEFIRQSEDYENNTFSKGGMKKNKYDGGSWLRYAPVLGSGLATLSDAFGLTNKPDYSNLVGIDRALEGIEPIGYTPITTKMSYTPFDTQFYSSKLAEQNAATKRALQNTAPTAGAITAGLLTADYNTQTKLGDLYRSAEEYNQAQKEKVLGFNRETEAMNARMAMKTAAAYQELNKLKLKAATTQAQLREQADATASAARSANITNFFENLGALGKEGFMMDMIKNNPALLYDYMGRYMGAPEDEAEGESEGETKACGGKINRRRRK